MAFELPPLPYDYAALEPVIDKQTMTLHHDMHHGAYVKNLNAAIEKHPELSKKSAEDLIRDLQRHPRRHSRRSPQQRRRPRQPLHVLENHEAQRWRRSHRPHRPGHHQNFRHLQRFPGQVQRCRRKTIRQRMGLAGQQRGDDLHIMSTPNQDNPISVRATIPSSATTSGSTPTT